MTDRAGGSRAFYAIHNYLATWFSEEAQAEYFAEGPDTISCTIPGLCLG